MEINGTNPSIANPNPQRVEASQESQRSLKTRAGQNPESDSLELSVKSREISHLEDLIRSTPDVREERVQAVRSQIESGTYNVKAEKIAEKIVGGNLLDEVY
jgi:negative regulator of flagellin synthesis FlgM